MNEKLEALKDELVLLTTDRDDRDDFTKLTDILLDCEEPLAVTIPRGLFIVFEGGDRCGKSTQASLASRALEAKGRYVKRMCFPERTTLCGQLIDDYLCGNIEMDGYIAHLLFALNRMELTSHIYGALAKGRDVVCDRYSHSGVVYSAAAKGIPVKWTSTWELELPRPDIIIRLFLKDSEVAESREGFGDELYENRTTQERVNKLFGSFSKLPYWEEVDGQGDIGEIHDKIMQLIESASQSRGGPIQKFVEADFQI